MSWIAALTPDASAATFYVDANGHNPAPPFATWNTAATNIQDAVSAAGLNDLILVTNGLYQYGGAPTGTTISNRVYVTTAMTIQSVNGPLVTTIKGASGFIRCVSLADGAILSGFTVTNGTLTGNASIGPGGGIFCAGTNSVVTNCIITGNTSDYGGGGGVYSGKLTNCSLSNNATSFRGAGAYSTILSNCIIVGNRGSVNASPGGGIYGGAAVNCVLSNNIAQSGGGADSASLLNCRLASNSAVSGDFGNGGGAHSSFLTNCLLIGNRAGGSGGGAANSTLVGCVIYRNYATNSLSGGIGGGVAGGILVTCTLVSNGVRSEMGLYAGVAKNSILYYNSGGNYNANLTNCCTLPLPASGIDNFTQPPLFVDLAGGDLHLQSTSPCINAGNNSYLPSPPGAMAADLDGNPRILGGTVDVGAYEYQSPASTLSYAWAQAYGLPTDGSADFADPDGDGMNNWQEWIAGTNPTDSSSGLWILTPSNNASGITITWQSVNTRTYYVQRATNLSSQPVFLPLSGYITGQSGTTSYTDTTATNDAALYRVAVQR